MQSTPIASQNKVEVIFANIRRQTRERQGALQVFSLEGQAPNRRRAGVVLR
jgi:hypothetical protein